MKNFKNGGFYQLNQVKFYKYIGYMVLFAFSLYICYKTIQTQKKIKEGMTDDEIKNIDNTIKPIKDDRISCKKKCLDGNNADKFNCLASCYDTCVDTPCPLEWSETPWKTEPDCSDKALYSARADQRMCQDFKEKVNYYMKTCNNACGIDPKPNTKVTSALEK